MLKQKLIPTPLLVKKVHRIESGTSLPTKPSRREELVAMLTRVQMAAMEARDGEGGARGSGEVDEVPPA